MFLLYTKYNITLTKTKKKQKFNHKSSYVKKEKKI